MAGSSGLSGGAGSAAAAADDDWDADDVNAAGEVLDVAARLAEIAGEDGPQGLFSRHFSQLLAFVIGVQDRSAEGKSLATDLPAPPAEDGCVSVAAEPQAVELQVVLVSLPAACIILSLYACDSARKRSLPPLAE